MNPGMEVEVSEVFGPAVGKRPANFVVLKYFLLGLMFSNAIECILIVPMTLSMMHENREQLEHLASIYEEHDAFKQELHDISLLNKKVVHLQKETFNVMTGEGLDEHEAGLSEGPAGDHNTKTISKHRKHNKVTFEESQEPLGGTINAQMNEYILLVYGIVTMAMGILAVFKEHEKLLMIFMGTTVFGLVDLFFAGLTLIVFMAILNDVIIALVSFKFLQMMRAPVPVDYYGNPAGVGVMGVNGMMAYPEEAAYNVDLNQGSTYVTQ